MPHASVRGSRSFPTFNISPAPAGAHSRSPVNSFDQRLSPNAQAWLESLGPHVQPSRLAAGFPHVVNRVSLCWTDPVLIRRVLDDLMLDHRGARRGFPAPVVEELMTLRLACGIDQSSGLDPWSRAQQATADR